MVKLYVLHHCKILGANIAKIIADIPWFLCNKIQIVSTETFSTNCIIEIADISLVIQNTPRTLLLQRKVFHFRCLL